MYDDEDNDGWWDDIDRALWTAILIIFISGVLAGLGIAVLLATVLGLR